MPKPFPREFRQDVVAVARKGEASRAQIARDFGVSEACLARWLKIADREEGMAAATPADEGDVRELKRRNKLLEQENEILRRATAYFARDVLPK